MSEASPFFRDSIMIEHHISLNATEKKIGHIFSHCIISVSVYYRSWWWWWWRWHIIYSYQLFQIYLFNTSIHYIYTTYIRIYIFNGMNEWNIGIIWWCVSVAQLPFCGLALCVIILYSGHKMFVAWSWIVCYVLKNFFPIAFWGRFISMSHWEKKYVVSAF